MADQPPDHEQLLVVLLAEHGDIRLGLVEQLGHHRGDTAEEMRPRHALEPLARPVDRDPGRVSLGVHHRDVRHPDELRSGRGELVEVARLVARVAGEVLGRRELARVDEDRDQHPVGALKRPADQREVPLVQGSHGRDEPDLEPGPLPYADPGPQLGQRPDDGRLAHDGFPSPARAAAGW
jgi:hypothetical protein